MWNKIASALAGVALALSVGTTQAATYDVNMHNFPGSEWSWDLDVVGVNKTNNWNAFSDTFNFLLGDDSNIWFAAAEASRDIEIKSVKLFDSSNNLVAAGDDFSFNFFGLFKLAGEGLGPLLLDAGSYFFLVSGKAYIDCDPAYYKFGVLAQAVPPTPVPLPPAALLLATGLTGLVGFARRRKTGAAKEPVAA